MGKNVNPSEHGLKNKKQLESIVMRVIMPGERGIRRFVNGEKAGKRGKEILLER